MARLFDAEERLALCASLDHLGASAPTLLPGWDAQDLAAHLVLRERDLIAAPCLVLPGPFARFAERHRVALLSRHDFATLVELVRTGPPPGFFRLSWVRSLANLNEFFVHHEDLRRANGFDPRALEHDLEAALWRNACRSGRYLSRRLRETGVELAWSGEHEVHSIRTGSVNARLSGPPGELLLYLFGRRDAVHVEITGPADAAAAIRGTRFGM